MPAVFFTVFIPVVSLITEYTFPIFSPQTSSAVAWKTFHCLQRFWKIQLYPNKSSKSLNQSINHFVFAPIST